MQKLLPFEIPSIETYQCDAFFLGICQSYNRSKNVYTNKFVNLQCENTVAMKQLDMKFVHSSWGDLYLEGVGELNLFHFTNFNKTTFINFLEERIDQECYLLLYEIDEYYLSYTESYKKQHYKHDTYIYGYDDDYFHVVAYSDKRLQKLRVHKKEIADCVLKAKVEEVDDFCSFRINQAANVEIDLKFILQNLENYCLGESSYDDTALKYGINIWNVVIECLDLLIKKNYYDEDDFDLRIFRLIWEHKKAMCDRIKSLKEYVVFDEVTERKLKEIADQAYIAFQLCFKYMVDHIHSCEKLIKVKKIYTELLSLERKVYPELIEAFRKSVGEL